MDLVMQDDLWILVTPSFNQKSIETFYPCPAIF